MNEYSWMHFWYNPISFVNFRIASNLGRALGVAFGCLIGMFPLLFLETGEVKEDDKCDDDKEWIAQHFLLNFFRRRNVFVS